MVVTMMFLFLRDKTFGDNVAGENPFRPSPLPTDTSRTPDSRQAQTHGVGLKVCAMKDEL
jgi:hypothetical protein